MNDLGTFVEHEGRAGVRFERTFRCDVTRAWDALTTPEGLAHWFPASVELDLRPGGRVAFTGDPIVTDRKGTVVACDPPRLLAFTWGADVVRFELEAARRGRCRFTLLDQLAARDAAARNAAGWYVCLAELAKHLDGRAADGPHSATALAWQPLYEAHLEAGLPSGAPVPDAV